MELIKHLYLSGCLEHSSITEEETELKRQEHCRDKLEAELQRRLNEEERQLFEAYDECRTMLTVLYGQTEFINGFRLGGQLAAEMLLEP